jgi:hypothetical protein
MTETTALPASGRRDRLVSAALHLFAAVAPWIFVNRVLDVNLAACILREATTGDCPTSQGTLGIVAFAAAVVVSGASFAHWMLTRDRAR